MPSRDRRRTRPLPTAVPTAPADNLRAAATPAIALRLLLRQSGW